MDLYNSVTRLQKEARLVTEASSFRVALVSGRAPGITVASVGHAGQWRFPQCQDTFLRKPVLEAQNWAQFFRSLSSAELPNYPLLSPFLEEWAIVNFCCLQISTLISGYFYFFKIWPWYPGSSGKSFWMSHLGKRPFLCFPAALCPHHEYNPNLSTRAVPQTKLGKETPNAHSVHKVAFNTC